MYAEKWAPAGAILSGLCLLEVGPVTALLRTVGLGFLLRVEVLAPLLAGLLGVTLWALATDRRYHRSPVPSRLAWAGSALLGGGLWLADPAAWAGLAGLAAGAVWNAVLVGRLGERRARAREVGRKI